MKKKVRKNNLINKKLFFAQFLILFCPFFNTFCLIFWLFLKIIQEKKIENFFCPIFNTFGLNLGLFLKIIQEKIENLFKKKIEK